MPNAIRPYPSTHYSNESSNNYSRRIRIDLRAHPSFRRKGTKPVRDRNLFTPDLERRVLDLAGRSPALSSAYKLDHARRAIDAQRRHATTKPGCLAVAGQASARPPIFDCSPQQLDSDSRRNPAPASLVNPPPVVSSICFSNHSFKTSASVSAF